MSPASNPPRTVDQLLQEISRQFDSLSKQLKLIAHDVEQNREHLGLDGIQEVAARCAVQPSAVIRFAKHFGFSGFTEMQKIFREGISRQISPGRSYQDRIRQVIASGRSTTSSAEIAREFLAGSIAGMQELQSSLDMESFSQAVDLLASAESIWIAGSGRSFSVAAFLEYALQHTDKRIQLISGLGGVREGQLRSMRPGEVMIAISFAPYAEETQLLADAAVQRGGSLIAITDSRMSPLVRLATATLLVQDSSTLGFRSLTSTMGLAQSLFIALAYQLELGGQIGSPTRHRSGEPA